MQAPISSPWKRRARNLIIYAILLAASHAVMWDQGRRARPTPGQLVCAAREAAGTNRAARLVDVAYHDLTKAPPGAPAVLILHGSPMHTFDLRGLAFALATNVRVVVPDLPGFGRSTRKIADYSYVAHADYLLQLLDALGLPRVHVIAHSMGGGPGLELARRAPERVASLTLLAAVGVEELELFGHHGVNHAIHGIQLGFAWTARNFVPHFGLLDGLMLNYSYCRNFYDADQRPLRGILAGYAGPLLIQHGHRDVLVPPAAAAEHHRIVPQSELVWNDAGHLEVFTNPALFAPGVLDFIGRVERGEALTRDRADPARVAAAAQPFHFRFRDRPNAAATLVLVILIALAALASEDLACIGAGLLAARGVVAFEAAALAAFLGILSGDLLLFAMGRRLGGRALAVWPYRWFFKRQALEDGALWLEERGPVAIFLSRFLPGSRLPTYFTAGMERAHPGKTLAWLAAGGVIWAPLLVWFSMLFGGAVLERLGRQPAGIVASLAATAFIVWLAVKVIAPLFTYRGRRLLVCAWKRKLHWEFWPWWIVYAVVFPYFVWLAIRHRGLTFAACNPAIPASGLVGESKSQILDGIQARDAVARYEKIPAELDARAKIRLVEAFMAREGLAFPVVVKPDAGQRGLGVGVLRDAGQLAAYFGKPRPFSIAQEFIAGQEFGLFYARHPDLPAGHVFSVTEKRFTIVVGDGRRTLERLILDDNRAVCSARFFLRRHRHQLDRVPADGESVTLNDIGNHARGMIFHDGLWALTPALEASVDRIAKSFPGFHFGRFDVRISSLDEFQRGGGFKVIELNGLTSEAAHMFDPKNGFWEGQRILRNQWRQAYEIGAANRAAGANVPTAFEMWRMWRKYVPAPEA